MNRNPLRPPTHSRWAQGAPRPHPVDDAAHVPASRRTLLTLLGGLVLAGAASFGLLSHPGRPGPAFTAADTGQLPTVAGAPVLTQQASAAGVDLRGAAPVRLIAPGVHLTAPVRPVGVTAGALDVPDDVHTLGWSQDGAAAGSRQGTVVVDGHVDSAGQGIGALASIARMRLGDRLTLNTAHSAFDYVVQARRHYPKDALPTDLFTRTGPARLALITCGGPFNTTTRHYRDNIVLYATPTPPLSGAKGNGPQRR